MRLILLFLCFILVTSCETTKSPETYPLPEAVLELPGYAKGFQFVTLGEERFLQFFDLVGEEPSVTHSIFLKDSIDFDWNKGKQVLLGSNPVFATLSTTHLAYFSKIEALSTVKGTAYAKWIQSETIKAEITNGSIADISGEKDIDFEKLVNLNPSALLTYPYGDTDYTLIEAAGIAVVPFSEYLEKHPLGRAEWIKVIGFLAGKEKEANAIFNEIESEYNALLALKEAKQNLELPEVFTGSHSNGMWYAPARSSFIAQFIKDAGGHYLFDDASWDETLRQGENIEMDFEVFISKAAEADYWGKVVYDDSPLTYAKVQEEDPRYSSLNAFKSEGIFYCNASSTDYFGDALLEPQYILADLMHLIHPEFFAAEESYIPHYFQPLLRE